VGRGLAASFPRTSPPLSALRALLVPFPIIPLTFKYPPTPPMMMLTTTIMMMIVVTVIDLVIANY